MSKIIAICGKICCGKTHYANSLKLSENAIVLSCDEITSMLTKNNIEFDHNQMLKVVKSYLLSKAKELYNLGVNVILDWGLWSRQEREYIKQYFNNHSIPYFIHYVKVCDSVWNQNINKRNNDILSGLNTTDYFVDEGLKNKLILLWEEPDSSEVDMVIPQKN